MRKVTRQRKQAGVAIAIVGVVILVAVLASTHKTTTNKQATRIASVKISSQGFVPSELVIKKNTKVTWTNTDTDGHTVGANPYPSHASLKALASKALVAGQTYSYTFTKSGTYYYHDDLHPTLNATVVVQ